MAKPVLALDYISNTTRNDVRPVCLSYGKESFLQREVFRHLRAKVLSGEDADFSHTQFDASSLTLSDTAQSKNLFAEVKREVSMKAMFGSDLRLVQVIDADAFISTYLRELEEYTGQPSTSGILFLQAGEVSSVSRFFQAVLNRGLVIDCRPDSVTQARIPTWLRDWGKREIHTELQLDAAEILVEMVGDNLGLLDQELRKLSVSVEPGMPITPEVVRRNAGSWRARQVWEMIDAALLGKVQLALEQLDKLLQLPETSPVGILAAMSASLRKFAVATRLFVDAEKKQRGRRVNMAQILQQAGFNQFYIGKTEKQMYQIGRQRGLKIPALLLQADADIKGASRSDPRLIIERLIIELANPNRR